MRVIRKNPLLLKDEDGYYCFVQAIDHSHIKIQQCRTKMSDEVQYRGDDAYGMALHICQLRPGTFRQQIRQKVLGEPDATC